MAIDPTDIPQGVQRIWLVRHGQTIWNEQGRFCSHSDIPLSPRGREQVRKIATQLQHMPIEAIYSSDLSRARETAEIIAFDIANRGRETARVSPKHQDLENVGETLAVSLPSLPSLPPLPSLPSQLSPIILSPAWREIDFGAWEGLTYHEIATLFPSELGFFTDPEAAGPPQGETLAEVLQRVRPALYEIVGQRHDGAVVIVSHGGVLRGLLCSLLGMPLRNQWQLRIDTGSLSAIDVSLDERGGLLASLVGLNINRGVQ